MEMITEEKRGEERNRKRDLDGGSGVFLNIRRMNYFVVCVLHIIKIRVEIIIFFRLSKKFAAKKFRYGKEKREKLDEK